ncbi:hypothetical protein GWO43_30835 [candidate division KSB1 bacterium]|nr:hypothetical protein [candidate division KSB1 bacterium]NIR73068.1 hypothetical protein [candidate division KSB1 bacterium]NIS28309.1 hypothetical protein [candidate division KSB1 bacterium]NIT75178.1 hypothetical protein [candidate division KSB1 bacterium]NIU29015.1 hypothetical protein [candidate division KSB1 bacterium]
MNHSETKFDFYHLLKRTVEQNKPVALATVISNQSKRAVKVAAKMLVYANGSHEGGLGNADLDKRVIRDALELLLKETSKTLTYEFEPEQNIEVYIESILPPPHLVIIGADPDAIPIVTLGKQLGFKVVLVDHRPNFANRDKYPDADETLVAQAEEVPQKVTLDEKTFVLIKTHNYLKDKDILQAVLKSKTRYIGQLGPKARAEDLLKDLSEEGLHFSPAELERLYAPVGLDIGAESPEQIALSVLGEMLAVKNGREGGFLRHQTQAIHPRD